MKNRKKETGFTDELFSDDIIENIKEYLSEEDPTLLDVWQAHEYRDGSKNVKQDYEKAALFYGKASKDGNPEAMYNLALMHMKGKGVKLDFKMAISLLKKASELSPFRNGEMKIPNVGVAEALHALGLAYEEGAYVERNYPLAADYFEKAVKLNYANSANNLGILFR